MTIFLDTPRLLLRHFTEDDAPLLFQLDSDPEVTRFVGAYGLLDVEAYRGRIRTKYLAYYATYPGFGFWAVVEKGTGEFLGWFCLRPALDYLFAAEAEFRADDLELGYRLRKSAWGRGYATEIATALVRKAFTELGATRIVAAALIQNVASTRVMEKAGLQYLGQFVIPGLDQPSVKYALSQEQFPPAS